MVDIKIPDLTLGTQLDGTEEFECVQGGNSRKIPASFFPSLGYGYLLINTQPQLTNSRRLVSGSGITFTDGGPGGDLTISGSASSGGPTYWDTVQSSILPIGNTDNFVLDPDIVILRVTPDAGGSAITGFDATANSGRMVVVLNIGVVGDLTLPNQAGGSLAANRLLNVGGFDIIVPPGGAARIWNDTISTAWRTI